MERKLLLLGMLRTQDMHGYQLNDVIDTHVESDFHLKKSTMYKLLNSMVDDGWLTCTSYKEGNYPTRRVYSITPEGEDAFLQLLRENLCDFKPADYQGNVGLLFMDALPQDEKLMLLQQRRETVEGYLKRTEPLDEIDHPTHDLIILYHSRHLEAELLWLDEVIATVTAVAAGN